MRRIELAWHPEFSWDILGLPTSNLLNLHTNLFSMMEDGMPRFAAVQMESVVLDTEANLEKIITHMQDAAAAQADVAVFPECALSGYALTAKEAASVAETIPGPSTERLIQACGEFGIFITVGIIEKGNDDLHYNACALLGPDGHAGTYRKTHLPYLGVDRYLTPGETINGPFDTPAGRLGILVCYDLRFPETARVLTLAGTQVLLVSTAWPQTATLYSDRAACTRSAENGIYLVAANHVGQERDTRFLGRSVITGPDGEMLAEAPSDTETILYADVDLSRSDAKQRVYIPGEYELDLIKDRRPELYSSLSDTS
jgi:predicted amidohydrolase